MQGKKRTTGQKQELYERLEPFFKEGMSLHKACEVADVPYTSMRDIMDDDLILRTKMKIAQSEMLSLAWKNVRQNLEKGDVKTSMWLIEKIGNPEPLTHAYEGGKEEQESRQSSKLMAALFGPESTETLIEVFDELEAEREMES